MEVKEINTNIMFGLLSNIRKNHISSILQELSMVEFSTLHILKRWHMMKPEEEITVSALSKYTDSSLPAVSRTLNQLEKDGFISREIGQKDRRAISVVLSKEGEQTLTREESRLKTFCDFIYKTMGTEDIDLLISLMARFQQASEQALIEQEKKQDESNESSQ